MYHLTAPKLKQIFKRIRICCSRSTLLFDSTSRNRTVVRYGQIIFKNKRSATDDGADLLREYRCRWGDFINHHTQLLSCVLYHALLTLLTMSVASGFCLPLERLSYLFVPSLLSFLKRDRLYLCQM